MGLRESMLTLARTLSRLASTSVLRVRTKDDLLGVRGSGPVVLLLLDLLRSEPFRGDSEVRNLRGPCGGRAAIIEARGDMEGGSGLSNMVMAWATATWVSPVLLAS